MNAYLINRVQPTHCKGNKNWVQVAATVDIIQRKATSERVRTGFRLKEQFAGIKGIVTDPAFPAEKPADAYEWVSDFGGWSGEHAEFYEAVYSEPAESLQEVAFEVISLDCEPVELPPYVKVDFPACVSEHPETWHKYQCSIGYEQVFNLIHDAVAKIVAENPDVLSMDDYKSIQTCTVQQRIAIPSVARRTRKVERFNSKTRPHRKFDDVTDTVKMVTLLQFVGKYKDRGAPYIQVQAMGGKNYEDLQFNLAVYIKSFTDKLDITRLSVCHHCFGSGTVKTKDQVTDEEAP